MKRHERTRSKAERILRLAIRRASRATRSSNPIGRAAIRDGKLAASAFTFSACLCPPRRYDEGFSNANCVACCNGGERYFRRERRLHSVDVAEVVQIQREIGPNAYFFRDNKTGLRFTPEDVPDDGPVTEAEAPDCSFYCAMAEQDIDE